jgi:hypothetical protein
LDEKTNAFSTTIPDAELDPTIQLRKHDSLDSVEDVMDQFATAMVDLSNQYC